mgnify:CR=1 FL=1|tara:strand:- start:33 stop:815 length:783 start_codon:yes stop_codon:yes gene_type:complete
MINLKKKTFPKASFPIIQFDNLLSAKTCNILKKAIEDQKKFDDFVMNGRNRINKGSSTFKKFLNKSRDAHKLYNSLNSKSTFIEILNIFNNNFQDQFWKFKQKKMKYSKINFGKQKGKELTKQKKSDKKRNVVNLDIDFSVSKNGYFREPHRDRSTRIINFLIYLNSIPKKNGGTLEIFKTKKKWGKFSSSYPRFPRRNSVAVTNKFQPKKRQGLFFLSSPDSYHGVSKFISKNNIKRVFIYGSFSLNKPVKWSFNSINK